MVEHPRIACFYLLPKIHKDMRVLSRWSIVSGNGNLCEPLCRYVDTHLKPLVELLLSYVKDTGDVLRKLDGIHLGEDMWSVTCDVEALYTSITHSQGLEAVSMFLFMNSMETSRMEFIMVSLEFILTHKIFLFKETLYLQFQGTTLGAACAPSYVNVFLGCGRGKSFWHTRWNK